MRIYGAAICKVRNSQCCLQTPLLERTKILFDVAHRQHSEQRNCLEKKYAALTVSLCDEHYSSTGKYEDEAPTEVKTITMHEQ